MQDERSMNATVDEGDQGSRRDTWARAAVRGCPARRAWREWVGVGQRADERKVGDQWGTAWEQERRG